MCQIWRMSVQLQYLQLITDQTITQLTCERGLFAILINVTRTIKILFAVPQISSKLANSDVTKETLNGTASLWQLRVILAALVSSGLLLCDPKTNSPQIRIRLRFRPDLKIEIATTLVSSNRPTLQQ